MTELNLHPINRRNLLRLSGYSLGGMLVGGSVLTLAESLVGRATEPLNQKVEELLLKPQTPVPEFSVSAIEPNALIVNTYDFTPNINLNDFRLVVDGEVNNPLSLDLAAIQKNVKKIDGDSACVCGRLGGDRPVGRSELT